MNDDNKIAKRTAAWEAVNSSKIELALSYWTSSSAVHQPDLIHLVIRILKEHGIDYMRAPYGAGPQVTRLLSVRPKKASGGQHGTDTNRISHY